MADDSSDSADGSSGGGFDFNSLLSTAVGAAPGVVQALTGKPASNGAAVAGTPAAAGASQTKPASSWTAYLPWVIGAAVILGGVALFRKKG